LYNNSFIFFYYSINLLIIILHYSLKFNKFSMAGVAITQSPS